MSNEASEKKIVTDSLGFGLTVTIRVGDFETAGRHVTHEDESGNVAAETSHRIDIQAGLDADYLPEVIAHEVYHLFYSIRHLIAVDEETEATVFGQLVKLVHRQVREPLLIPA